MLYVGVLVGFINQIIKGIAATNTSNDFFMGKELNAALGFNKAMQKFLWDMMKYVRFVTEFKGNWTTKPPRRRALISPATWRGGRRRGPSRRTRRTQARARRSAAARHLQCTQRVFAKTTDSTVKVINMLSRKARNKLTHALNCNTVETKGREASARKATTNVIKKWITFLPEMTDLRKLMDQDVHILREGFLWTTGVVNCSCCVVHQRGGGERNEGKDRLTKVWSGMLAACWADHQEWQGDDDGDHQDQKSKSDGCGELHEDLRGRRPGRKTSEGRRDD